MPTLPTPITPYYGGGQVQNPANVIPTVGAPSTHFTEDRVGTVAVDNAAANIYGLASKSGGIDTWVLLGGNSGPGSFPITPFVVGPVGKAGFQTIQSAMTAANTAGGGMVYVQPGTYTENLTWYTGVYVCSLPPQSANPSATFPITIIGNHTIVAGTGGIHLWGATGIQFQCTGIVFTSALTSALNSSLTDCTINASEGFIFSIPSIDPSTNSSFTLLRVNVLSGGTSAVTLVGNIDITNSQMGLNGVNPLTVGSGVALITNSTIEELVINNTGNIQGSFSFFNDTVTLASASGGSGIFQTCYFSSADSCVLFNSGAGGTFTDCELFSGATYTISGNSTATISITDTTFTTFSGSFVDPALTGTVWTGTTQGSIFMAAQALVSGIATVASPTNGTLITAPPASITATTALGTITVGSPIQNSLGYDVNISGNVFFGGTVSLTISVGVGPSATPTTSDITGVIAATDLYVPFSAYVPAGYYFSLGAVGSGGASIVYPVVTPA